VKSSYSCAFWYTVVQPAVLKNERNCAIINLLPLQMVLVEKLWVLGPSQVLAQVSYPKKGYVPRETRVRGQLITRFESDGRFETNKEIQWQQQGWNFFRERACNLPSQFMACDTRASMLNNITLESQNINLLSQEEFSARPFWTEKTTSTQLKSSQNSNQTPDRSCRPKKISAKFQRGKSDNDLQHGSGNAKHTSLTNTSVGNLFNSFFDSQWSYTANLGHGRSSGSLVNKKKMGNLPPFCRRLPSVETLERNNDKIKLYRGLLRYKANSAPNRSFPCLLSSDSEKEVRSIVWDINEKCNEKGKPKYKRRTSLVEQLLNIYYGYDDHQKSFDRKDLGSATRTICKSQVSSGNAAVIRGPIAGIRKHWRYDPDRWVIVSALCYALEDMCSFNKRWRKNKDVQLNMTFHVGSIPDISIPAYLERIAWFLECPKACFVLALEYIHRLAQYKQGVVVNYNSVHQLVIICVMVAAKFIDDKIFKNTVYARVGGLSARSLSALEVKLLFFLGFDLHVVPERYNERYKDMLMHNKGPRLVTIRPKCRNVKGFVV